MFRFCGRVEQGLNLIRKGGRCIQQRIVHQSVQLKFDQILFDKEISIVGSRTNKPSSWGKAINLAREEKVNLKELCISFLVNYFV
ncbi:MAG TPA: hypothetical protein ENO17_10500 [Candidatus Atribacteria bacterium]|nr:hypothetical protein [Candidatus Atribacteria bacterium]